MAPLFEPLRVAINRVADGYEAKRQEYLQAPEKFKHETRGNISFTVKADDIPGIAAKALPAVLESMLPSLMKPELEYVVREAFPSHDINVNIDSRKVAQPDINDFPAFPKEQILSKLRVAEAELKSGWTKQPGTGDTIATRIAQGKPPITPDKFRTSSLVKEFTQEGEQRPLAVTLLHALAKGAFSFDSETHMGMYSQGAQGHVFPGDAGIVKDSKRWVVAFSADDTLGRNAKADNVLDLLGVNSVSPSR